MSKRFLYSVCSVLFILQLHADSADLIPFSLPWNDGKIDAPGVLNLDGRELPAGKNGFIRIENGHFADGAGKRIRLLGVNLAFSGNYPSHQQADSVAGHMAKYGITSVRFHHTDTLRAPNGIWKEGRPDKQTLDPDNLDRMDYFINALKQKGIYTNINLKIGREVVAGDGFTEVDKLPTYDKGPDHYFPRMIELQKNYARDLLTHKNPYTGNRYVDEPALAIVEINNESGLVGQWAGNDLDAIPPSYIDPLQANWNGYLTNKYKTTDALRAAWASPNPGTGQELLTNGSKGWALQQVEQGKGNLRIVPEGPDGADAIKINVTSVGTASWHVQIVYRGLKVKQGGYYKVRLQLRADSARRVSIGLKMDHTPWSNLDDYSNADVTGEWKTYEYAFSPSQDDSLARLDITGLADKLGTMWIANASMIDSSPEGLPEGQTLEQNNVAWIPRAQYSQKAAPIRRDWMEFLVQRETQYYREMNQFLKKELGVKSIITGTQLSFGTAISQMENDFIDIHGYWNHPNFPNKPWDSIDWTIVNESILPAQDNVLEKLMMSRIDGYAYTCSEYNHPAPNTYSSEGIPLMAAYAAFQDWDAIYFFAYSHNNDYAGHSINNFFDICGHTPKMMAFPAAYNLFVRGDVSPARQTVRVSMTQADYLNMLTERNGSLWFTPLKALGIAGTAPYQHKTVLRFTESTEAVSNPEFNETRLNMEADTGELIWNQIPANRSYSLIRAQKTKGFIGFVNGMTFELGDGIKLDIGSTRQDWANILFTYLGTSDEGYRWLLTATGYHENTGMVWKNEEKNSVGNQWGGGPPLVEPVPLQLTLASDAGNHPDISLTGAKVYSLNNLAERGDEIPQTVQAGEGGLTIDLMNPAGSLWYEIVFDKKSAVSNDEKY